MSDHFGVSRRVGAVLGWAVALALAPVLAGRMVAARVRRLLLALLVLRELRRHGIAVAVRRRRYVLCARSQPGGSNREH
jgi:hypothetical protein